MTCIKLLITDFSHERLNNGIHFVSIIHSFRQKSGQTPYVYEILRKNLNLGLIHSELKKFKQEQQLSQKWAISSTTG